MEEIQKLETNIGEVCELVKGLTSTVKIYNEYLVNLFLTHMSNTSKMLTEMKNQINELQQQVQELKGNNNSDECKKEKEDNSIEIEIVNYDDSITQITSSYNIQQFNSQFTSSRKIFDTNQFVSLSKKPLEETDPRQLKQFFYKSISNKTNLLFINISENGKLFGAFLQKPCCRKDIWVVDDKFKLFSFDRSSQRIITYSFKNEKKDEDHKAFYFKSEGNYLYAFYGIVIQAEYTKPYSQIHNWLTNVFAINDPSIFIGHNNLFKCIRTLVFQLN